MGRVREIACGWREGVWGIVEAVLVILVEEAETVFEAEQGEAVRKLGGVSGAESGRGIRRGDDGDVLLLCDVPGWEVEEDVVVATAAAAAARSTAAEQEIRVRR